MTTGKAAPIFTAALVQLRSGLHPDANLDGAIKLIGEAKSGGPDYVQTPEMTNVLALKREQLFAVIAEEDSDKSLAAFRELARKLGIYLHIGSLAIKLTAEKAANRSFLIGRDGEILARYDKIHMFDVDLANGRAIASRQLPAGRDRRGHRPAVGPAGLSVCYDLGFPTLYRALAEAGALLAVPSAFTKQTGEAHWMCSCARARSRTARSCLRPRRAASMRTAARPSDIRSSSTPGPHPGRRRHGARRLRALIDPAEIAADAPDSLAPARAAVRDHRADRGTHPAARRRGADMIRYALACDEGHSFEAGSRIPRPTTNRSSAASWHARPAARRR